MRAFWFALRRCIPFHCGISIVVLDQEMKLNTTLRIRVSCEHKHSEDKHTEIPAFWLSPHFISSCSSGNLDSGFTIDIYTETCCVAKRMSKRCELARSIHLCNVVLTFLVCEHDTILMILMIRNRCTLLKWPYWKHWQNIGYRQSISSMDICSIS